MSLNVIYQTLGVSNIQQFEIQEVMGQDGCLILAIKMKQNETKSDLLSAMSIERTCRERLDAKKFSCTAHRSQTGAAAGGSATSQSGSGRHRHVARLLFRRDKEPARGGNCVRSLSRHQTI
jgi:hypothetical protein